MSILIFNAGSSSLKFKLFDDNLKELKSDKVERVGKIPVKDHKVALSLAMKKIGDDINTVAMVGHRIVHGGDIFEGIEKLDKDKTRQLDELSALAPLHNPKALDVIKALTRRIAKLGIKIPQYAIFDTAFYKEMPKSAKYYPLPYKFYKNHKIKRYGFHGISHRYAMIEVAKKLKVEPTEINLITVHLGAGCSITAIEHGLPIDTSMGFTPNEGPMMMTRSGSLSPEVIFYLLREMKIKAEKVEEILNEKSGMMGISGVSNDMKDILFVAGVKVEDPDYVMPKDIKCDRESIKRCELALEMFINSIKKYIGGYILLLGEVDAIVFTGEIGYGSSFLRKRIAGNLSYKIIAVKPNEELAIARMIKDNK